MTETQSDASHPEKATISNLDEDEGASSSEHTVKCSFNPTSYKLQKTVGWTRAANIGGDAPSLDFKGGDPATIVMTLLFDTFESGKDVRDEYIDKLWRMTQPQEKYAQEGQGPRPPRVLFAWGKTWSFEAVIDQITVDYTLFSPNGTPLRATVGVTFKQLKDETGKPRQNPTSGGRDNVRVWQVRPGDTLPGIAHAVLGDASRWRSIASYNRINNTGRLRAGTTLLIPHG